MFNEKNKGKFQLYSYLETSLNSTYRQHLNLNFFYHYYIKCFYPKFTIAQDCEKKKRLTVKLQFLQGITKYHTSCWLKDDVFEYEMFLVNWRLGIEGEHWGRGT